MSWKDTALAVRHVTTDNPNLKTLIPHHHHGTPQASATTIAEVRVALAALGITIPMTNPVRGQGYEFSK